MLHGELLPFISELGIKKTIFQRDNAPIRLAATINMWFQDFGIKPLPWSALSPDPSPNENPWGILGENASRIERSHLQKISLNLKKG